MEHIHFQPLQGKSTDGRRGVALLTLPEAVNLERPVLAARSFHLSPGTKVYAFKLSPGITMAEFDVVHDDFCPGLKDSGLKGFCIFSRFVLPAQGALLGWLEDWFTSRRQSIAIKKLFQQYLVSGTLFMPLLKDKK